jgi:hypothetical protein
MRVFLFGVGFLLLAGACTQRMICPAYQSAFIYDKESLRKKFSYFKEDSTPKVYTASAQNRYLVAVPESYRKKLRRMQTVEMQPVYPVIPDSLKVDHEAGLLMAERDVADSVGQAPADSVYAITKTKEKYNVDQDIYMWYFRDLLVLPDVRAAMQANKANQTKSAPAAAKKKKGLFGSLFKKKVKDSLQLQAPADSASAKPAKKTKLTRKDKKAATPDASKKKDPAKKEEEDDGF